MNCSTWIYVHAVLNTARLGWTRCSTLTSYNTCLLQIVIHTFGDQFYYFLVENAWEWWGLQGWFKSITNVGKHFHQSFVSEKLVGKNAGEYTVQFSTHLCWNVEMCQKVILQHALACVCGCVHHSVCVCMPNFVSKTPPIFFLGGGTNSKGKHWMDMEPIHSYNGNVK